MRNIIFFMGSYRAFLLIMVAFFISSAWLATTKAYPGVFDETYHFAIIEHYSSQLSPFITVQPPELAIVGDATRLGSYLSHYLLSFPLRIVEIFSSDIYVQIVVIRYINIFVMIGSLIIFKKFLNDFIKSRVSGNIALSVFCLLPVSSQLASTINYDNWIMLCFAVTCLFLQKTIDNLNKHGKVSLPVIFSLLIVLLAGSLTKYSYLPIAVSVVGIVIILIVAKYLSKTKVSVTLGVSKLRVYALLFVLVLMSGLALERYGYNILEYGRPQPDCAAVQSTDVCMQYGPWARNHLLESAAESSLGFETRSVGGYIVNLWIPISIQGVTYFGNNDNMVVLSQKIHHIISIVFVIILAGSCVVIARNLKNIMVVAIVTISLTFLLVLISYNYIEYLKFHEPIAVQGRYLLTILIPILGIGMAGMRIYSIYAFKLVKALSFAHRQTYSMDIGEAMLFIREFWTIKLQNLR